MIADTSVSVGAWFIQTHTGSPTGSGGDDGADENHVVDSPF